MRLIDRYICREVFSHALLGLAVFTFVFFVPQLVRLMELVVRHSGGLGTVVVLFVCTLPGVLTFTLPMAVLVGVLIGLGRMSADGEVIALQSLGLGRQRLLAPIVALALLTGMLTLLMTFWLGPAAVRTFRGLEDELRASQASFQVQPRVFDERFPRMVLYVQDVEAGGTRWRGLFLAESGAENGSRLTLAEEAIVVADREQGKLQFHLRNGSTHEYNAEQPDRYSVTTFGESDLPVAVAGGRPARERELSMQERSPADLLAVDSERRAEALIEFHRRVAFPAACLVFALLGVPMGARPRRGGRAAGFIVTLLLICGYYVLFTAGVGLARQGALHPALGVWTANIVAAALALSMMRRIEQIRSESRIDRVFDWARAWWKRRRAASQGRRHHTLDERLPQIIPGGRAGGGLPSLVDLYILRHFFYYFTGMLAGFVVLLEVFTFFELLDDIGRHNIPFLVVADYFIYLMPHLIYQLAPLAALVAVLVTLGVMSKNNEIVAFKACGVSLYRLSFPLLIAGLLVSAGLLALDNTYLPYTNQRQDALRNQIKGRPAQTFYQPRRQWIFGQGTHVYNYELFDSDRSLFGGLTVLQLDPQTFQLRRRIFASRAVWNAADGAWLLEDGWVREFTGREVTEFVHFQTAAFADLREPPDYFRREVKRSYQMNWRELQQYIRDLQQAGFDVAQLSVQWHKKLAFPLLLPIIMLLAIPFAFLVGARGAIGGLAVAVGIAIVYWAAAALFEAMGGVGQLPPLMAGWAPDAIFGFVGLYFYFRMPT